MPIRFRCVYCKQLMGISRRKGGSVVRCPKCNNQVMVPVTDAAPASAGATAQEPLFERSDFDELINQAAPAPAQVFDFDAPAGAGAAAPPMTAAPPATSVKPAPPPTAVEVEQAVAVDAASPARGILLTPAMATALAVCVVIGLAIAFVVGLFLGYRLHPHEEPSQSRAASPAALVCWQHETGQPSRATSSPAPRPLA